MDPRSTIQAHYATGYEAERLARGHGELERLRTQEVLRRHLPAAPARILDVGGGPGVYAAWLAEQCHDVALVDLVELHVEQARRRFAELGVGSASARMGDARALEEATASRDVVLLMGPLYHLQEPEDRARALSEARRVLRPGGLLVATAISRFASVLDGFARGFIDDPAFVAIVEEDLRSGRHENPPGEPAYFATAYFHRPEELAAELRAAGFDLLELLGVEGPFWCMRGFEERWAVPEHRAWILEHARRLEAEPALRGASAHLLAVASAPEAGSRS